MYYNHLTKQLTSTPQKHLSTSQKAKSRMRATRERYANAYLPWEPGDDQLLDVLFSEGASIERLTHVFKRNAGAISARIRKLNLSQKYSE
jgi:hypothetical protein